METSNKNRFFANVLLQSTLLLALILPAIADATVIEDTAPLSTDPAFTQSPWPVWMYNDRSGVGRTFRSVTGDYVRWDAYAYPSPDSDFFPSSSISPIPLSSGDSFLTTNGAGTQVNVSYGTTNFPMLFVGSTSGLGGGPNQYTTARALNTLSAGQIAFLDATPATFNFSNGADAMSLTGPDYNPAAMPNLITDITIEGGGLDPTIRWTLPAESGASEPIVVAIRRVEGSISDGTFNSFLIGRATLPAGATSFSASDINFNFIPGETGLQTGKTYEVAVQLTSLAPSGSVASWQSPVQGISRTFFEFTPLPDGSGGTAVYLPSVDAAGVYHFDIKVTAATPVTIDPTIAVGYDYAVGVGDPLFRSVSLPQLGGASVDYSLYLFDALGNAFDTGIDILSGTIFDFTSGALSAIGDFSLGLDKFGIRGIPESAMLDPTSVTAFLTTLTFMADGRFTGTMTPITRDMASVPAPAPLALIGAGLLLLRHRRAKGIW
jgi:hypothetical protein